MSFGLMAGLGLLGLIGIPILIIIYIIKPKFQERKISSTYIWKLSLKYRKRKIPLQWLKSLLLIVQCIIVAVLAFLLAKPYIGRAMNSYDFRKCVIIDASASMMTVEDGQTRYDRAIDAACEIAETATDENTMTVILCADEPTVVVSNGDDPSNIQMKLKSLKKDGAKGTEANYGKSIEEAIKVMGSANAGYTLITDHDYRDPGFFEVINISKGTWNFAINEAWEDVEDQEYAGDTNGDGKVGEGDKANPYYLEKIFYSNFVSYNKQLTVIPCALIKYAPATMDEIQGDAAIKEATIKLPKVTLPQAYTEEVDENGDVVFDENGNPKMVAIENVYRASIKYSYEYLRQAVGGRFTTYESIEFYAEDENGVRLSDAFTDDDRYFVMADGSNEKYKVLLMGNDADGSLWYLESMLQAINSCYVERVIPSELLPTDLAKKNSGYDLYVYDGYFPTTVPNDGAVWIINPQASYNSQYEKFGFSVAGETTVNAEGAKVYQRNAGHTHMAAISEIEGIRGIKGVFAYTKYTQATIKDNMNIANLVTTSDGTKPLIFAGQNSSRIKFTVFSFDLKFTDFPLVFQNFPIMCQNIVSNSVFHTILNGADRPAYGDYIIGEEIKVNVEPNCTKLVISVGEEDNLQETTYEGVVDLNKTILHTLDRGGLYTITQTISVLQADGSYKDGTLTKQLFVKCNADESNFALQGDILTAKKLEDDQIASGSGMKKDLIYKYFAFGLIILLLIEWGLQYREQY